MATFSKPTRRIRSGKKSKHYWVRVNEGGRRTWRSTKQETLALAKEVVRKWQHRDAQGELHVQELGFDEAVDQWIEVKRPRVSDACIAVYAAHASTWKQHFKARRLQYVETADINRFLARRRRKGTAARTLNNERATMSSFFEWAVGNQLARTNPVKRTERFGEEKRHVRTLEVAEEDKLLKAARAIGDQPYGFIFTLLRSGLRRGTVAALDWIDIDFARGEWRIPAAKMKSREDFVGRPIAPDLLEYLRERARPAGQVFGSLRLTDWKTAAEAAGLSWLRPHDLRRNFVTRCRRAGVPLEVTMHLSDHRDLRVVLECYRGVDPSEAADAIRSVFGAARESAGVSK